MLAANEPSDNRVFDDFCSELPKHVLAPYICLAILRKEIQLSHITKKLQNYVGFDLKLHSSITSSEAREIEGGCDTTNVCSVVQTVCQLSVGDLNIIGV